MVKMEVKMNMKMKMKWIAYMSAKINKAQKNFIVTESESYAVQLSVEKLRPYVEGLPFTIITDHSNLKWLMSQKGFAGRLVRWSTKLQNVKI